MEFRIYQAKFMRYQYEFYRRSDEYDSNRAFLMLTLSNETDIQRIYDGFKDGGDYDTARRIIFEYDFLDTYDQKMEKLKSFEKEVKKAFLPQPIYIDGLAVAFPFDYVRDRNGKVEPELLFSRWKRYLSVWDPKKRGQSLTQISMETGRYNELDVPNSLKPIKRDLASAKFLIDTSVAGTFPYPSETAIRPEIA